MASILFSGTLISISGVANCGALLPSLFVIVIIKSTVLLLPTSLLAKSVIVYELLVLKSNVPYVLIFPLLSISKFVVSLKVNDVIAKP